jgi:hypothetical protein
MQVIAEVRDLERAIQDQLQVIDGFSRANGNNIQLVNSFLKGSVKSHDQLMIETIRQTEQKLTEAKAQLERAAAALQRVQMI